MTNVKTFISGELLTRGSYPENCTELSGNDMNAWFDTIKSCTNTKHESDLVFCSIFESSKDGVHTLTTMQANKEDAMVGIVTIDRVSALSTLGIKKLTRKSIKDKVVPMLDQAVLELNPRLAS